MITVIINGVICPTVNNDPVLVTRSIADIQNPDERQIDHSKGFLIENTAAVQTLFSQIFEVNYDIQNVTEVNFTPDFNPNLKASIVVLNDNAVTLRGYCQMIDIVISDDNKVQYNINAYAAIGNFFNDIKNLFLAALDFSDYDHDWTYDNVTDSWTPTLGTGYVYPMIDYGLTTNYDIWSITSFRPALFVKDIIDRLFAAAGWQYSSAFFNTTRFKSLIIPFSAEKLFLTNDEIADRSYLVASTSPQTQTLKPWMFPQAADPIIFNDDSGPYAGFNLHNTSGVDYDTTTGIFTCSVAGNYQFGITGTFNQVNNTISSGIYGTALLALYRKRGSLRVLMDSVFMEFNYTPPGSPSAISLDTNVAYTSLIVNADVGDEYYWCIIDGKFYIDPIRYIRSNGSNIDVIIDTDSGSSLIPQSNLVYGDQIDMNSLLPSDIGQKDFIMSLAKMFNLYFEQTDEKTLLIEPRDDYFLSTIEDWTELIDIGNKESPPKYIPMGMNQQKRYKFSYQDDKDFQNQRYLSEFQQVYGTELYDVTTDFLTNTYEVKPIFAATPLSNALSGKNNRIISDMRFADEDGSNVKSGQTKLRILYWGGLITCNQWTLRNTPTPGSFSALWSTYPYAGHLDNPYNPQFDLNFGIPEAIYYDNNIGATGNVEYTDANLFNIYWWKTIKEYTNKNSKVLEAMFDISLYRYMTLSFRKQYFIKEAYYRLLEMEDYNLEGTSLVKCRLLKVDRQNPFTTSIKSVGGGTGVFDGGGKIPTKGNTVGGDGKIIRIDDKFTGDGGYTAGADVINRGSDNIIPFSGDKVYIFGSDGVTATVSKAFVFNSDGAILLRDGAMFNGVDLERKFELSVDETFIQEIDASNPVALLPELAANEHYEVTKFYLSISGGTTNYAGTEACDILIKSGAGTLIAYINGADWLGQGDGTIVIGQGSANAEFGEGLTIEVNGGYTAGDRDLKFVVFYKIIII